jgi:serine/threonine protein kinase
LSFLQSAVRPFDYLASREAKKELFINTTFSLKALEARSYRLWFHIIQTDDIHGIQNKVLQYIRSYPFLNAVKDADGRVAVDVAKRENKKAIQSVLLWHGRYRLLESRPEHSSATCHVFRAVDEFTVDESTDQHVPVALKLMRNKDHFIREVITRRKEFSPDYVVNIIETHPPLEPLLVSSSGSGEPPTLDEVVQHAKNQLNSWPDFVEIDNDAPAPSSSSSSSSASNGATTGAASSSSSGGGDSTAVGGAPLSSRARASTGQLTKDQAERLFCIIMPLADRNMYVALKQERWAGRDMAEVRHVFSQLVGCVQHIHTKGVLHGDIKPLNMVRTNGKWRLIDLDASCEIGVEAVGHKSSSSYVPPEAVFTDVMNGIACVRSNTRKSSLNAESSAVAAAASADAAHDLIHSVLNSPSTNSGSPRGSHDHHLAAAAAATAAAAAAVYDPLFADPSFDVWSLGCFLYQLCTTDVKPLFHAGQDDNLTDNEIKEDNLWVLAAWSHGVKAEKLIDVPDRLARNLLSQMLQKNPKHRPTLARVLAHPFLSTKKVARLVGDKPHFDVFLSYRVASDYSHAEKLYDALIGKGVRVWWDKKSLEPGEDWKVGFCSGLVSSKAFVCLLSRDAINNAEIEKHNYSVLKEDSPCDSLLLEQRLALELQGLGLIEKIFPLMIGDHDPLTNVYGKFFEEGCCPVVPDICVKSIEEDLLQHMDSQALGTPLEPNKSIAGVLKAITSCQGAFIEGDYDLSIEKAVRSIIEMLSEKRRLSNVFLRSFAAANPVLLGSTSQSSSIRSQDLTVKLHKEILHTREKELKELQEELERVKSEKDTEIARLRDEVAKLAAFLRRSSTASTPP